MIDRLKTPTVFAPLVTMAGFALCWYIIHHGVFTDGRMLDTPIYSGYAEHMKDGQLPYRDFVEVYPPLALPVFLIPGLIAGQHFSGFTEVFEAIMLVCGLGAVGLASYMVASMGESTKRLAGAMALGFVVPTMSPSPLVRRGSELLESSALAAMVPLTCWTCGLYEHVRGMGLT